MLHLLFLEIDFSGTELSICKKVNYKREVYPVFFEHSFSDHLVLGYGSKESIEYLEIDVDFARNTLTLERDTKSTLVLYYRFENNLLTISSEISDFGALLSENTINQNHILFFLSQGMNTESTLISGVNLLLPERTYIFKKDELSVERRIENNVFSKEIEDLNDMVETYLSNYTSDNIGFEISGGSDSSLFPFLCKHSDFECKLQNAFSVQINGNEGEIQKKTIDGICEFLNVKRHYHQMTPAEYPFVDRSSYNFPLDLRTENYYNSFIGEVDLLKKFGIDTIFNGIGGDEMFMVQRPFRKTSKVSKIFNEKFRDDIKKAKFVSFENNPFPNSIYDAVVSRNSIYTRNGIWQVSPFHDKAVYQFFRNLGTSKIKFYKHFYRIFGDEVYKLFQNNQNFRKYFWNYTNTKFFSDSLDELKNFSILEQYLDWKFIEKVMNDDVYNPQNLDLRYNIYLCLKIYFSLNLISK